MGSKGSSVAASYPARSVWFGLVWDFFFFFLLGPSAPLPGLHRTTPCCEMWSAGSIRAWRVWVPLESQVPGERRLMTLWRPLPPPPPLEAWVHTVIRTHWTCAGLCNCWPGHMVSFLCFLYLSQCLKDPIETERLQVCFPFSPYSLDKLSSFLVENA